MKILSPHIDPREEMMNASARTILFLQLKNHLPKFTQMMVTRSGAMDTRIRLSYKDGPLQAFEHWDKFANDKTALMEAANLVISEINKWEKNYLNWMAQVHGEQAVKDKLGLK